MAVIARLTLDNGIEFLVVDSNPSLGISAGAKGSIAIFNGQLYQKNGDLDTDWSKTEDEFSASFEAENGTAVLSDESPDVIIFYGEGDDQVVNLGDATQYGVGKSFDIINDSGLDVSVEDFSSNLVYSIPSKNSLKIILRDNSTQNGIWVFGNNKGTTGVQGIQGATGVQGVDGQTGIEGATGVQGFTGIQGETGVNGATGIQGETGVAGIQGETGVAGQTGVQGFSGTTGIQGETGVAGQTGVNGATGIQGETGVAGETGIQGHTGIQGETGVSGATGVQGQTGVAGQTGVDGTTGVQGETGVAGATGVQGEDGATGVQGETGIQGETGVQGNTGVQGQTGLQVNYAPITKEPTGYVNRLDTEISFNELTRTFSISPVGENYRFFIHGVEYLISEEKTLQISDESGIHIIYFDTDGELHEQSVFDISILRDKIFTALIYWDSENGKAVIVGDERHGLTMDWATHQYLHRTKGFSFSSGLVIGDFITSGDGSLNSHSRFSLTGGTLFDEDIDITVVDAETPNPFSFEQVLSEVAYLPVLWKEGSGNGLWVRGDATEFPVKQGTSRIQYNKLDGSWSLEDASEGSFVAMWIFATDDIREPIIFRG